MKSVYYQCQRPTCRFRFPAVAVAAGYLCPKCGAPVTQIAELAASPGEESIRSKHFTISVLLDNIRSAYNVGSIFRTADGAGVSEIILCGITPSPDHPGAHKTSLGAERIIPWKQAWNAVDICNEYKAKGYNLFVLEKAPAAVALPEFIDGYAHSKTLLAIGNEITGVDPEVLGLADKIVYIPMAGKKESLNVSVAFGICVYWLVLHS